MRTNARVLVAAAMTLGAIATAHADQYGYSEAGWATNNSMQSQPSTLTRAEVKGEVKAELANGTLPRYDESYRMPAPMGTSTLTRAEVRAQGRAATLEHAHAKPSTEN